MTIGSEVTQEMLLQQQVEQQKKIEVQLEKLTRAQAELEPASNAFSLRHLSATPRNLGSFIEEGDHIGITFSIAAGIMLISTAFFFFQATKVPGHWRTSMFVIGCVTGTAFWHYQYLADMWVTNKHVLPVYRYVDWFLTVPCQIIEFYLILKASCSGVGPGLFWKLLSASIVMLLGGYFGETELVNQWMAFFVGMIAWLFIIYEIFTGECATLNRKAEQSVQDAFKGLRFIVTFGWALYPIGYVVGNGTGNNETAEDALNGIYNIADLVNKTAFGLVLFVAATTDRKREEFVQQDELQQEKSRQLAQDELNRQFMEMQLLTAAGGMSTPGSQQNAQVTSKLQMAQQAASGMGGGNLVQSPQMALMLAQMKRTTNGSGNGGDQQLNGNYLNGGGQMVMQRSVSNGNLASGAGFTNEQIMAMNPVQRAAIMQGKMQALGQMNAGNFAAGNVANTQDVQLQLQQQQMMGGMSSPNAMQRSMSGLEADMVVGSDEVEVGQPQQLHEAQIGQQRRMSQQSQGGQNNRFGAQPLQPGQAGLGREETAFEGHDHEFNDVAA